MGENCPGCNHNDRGWRPWALLIPSLGSRRGWCKVLLAVNQAPRTAEEQQRSELVCRGVSLSVGGVIFAADGSGQWPSRR